MKSISGLVFPIVLMLTGCAGSMTGLDGQGGFSCKAPDGISCASLSGVYANAVQNNLPGQRPTAKPEKAAEAVARIDSVAPRSSDPIRSAQKVRRVWFAPWEDEDQVLHDQAYAYLVIDPGRWQIEHSRRKATEGYRPVMPPTLPGNMLAPRATNAGDRQSLQMERMNSAPGAPPSVNAAGAQPLRSLPTVPAEVE